MGRGRAGNLGGVRVQTCGPGPGPLAGQGRGSFNNWGQFRGKGFWEDHGSFHLRAKFRTLKRHNHTGQIPGRDRAGTGRAQGPGRGRAQAGARGTGTGARGQGQGTGPGQGPGARARAHGARAQGTGTRAPGTGSEARAGPRHGHWELATRSGDQHLGLVRVGLSVRLRFGFA